MLRVCAAPGFRVVCSPCLLTGWSVIAENGLDRNGPDSHTSNGDACNPALKLMLKKTKQNLILRNLAIASESGGVPVVFASCKFCH